MTEKERNIQIKNEFSRIIVFFQECPENEKSIILPLIQNAAFMRVALDDLQETIARDGPVDHYQNGANQYGTKQSAALQGYVVLQKTYLQTIKSLADHLPPEKKASLDSMAEARAAADRVRETQRAREHQAWLDSERNKAEVEGRAFDEAQIEAESRERPEHEQHDLEHDAWLKFEMARAVEEQNRRRAERPF